MTRSTAVEKMEKAPIVIKKRVKSILISQPKPENGKSPFLDFGKKHKIKIDFRPFIKVEDLTSKEFRKNRITLHDYSAIIFNSKNSVDHFFRMCDEMRDKMSQETKYFCKSEAIALYLQKYILYRKRKVFYSNGSFQDFATLLKKHRANEKFLFPCANVRKDEIPNFLKENEFDYSEAAFYKTVVADLSDLENIFYDMIVFFSPSGIDSLFENFPKFVQNETRIAAFGPTTCQSVINHKLRVDVKAPVPGAPSMTMAIEQYLKEIK